MKSVLGRNITTENATKLHVYGSVDKPVTTYSKSDFLTPTMVGKKYGITTEEAKKLMQTLMRNGVVFGLNGHIKEAVVRLKKTSNTIYLHPMATEVFQEYLNKKVK